MRTYKTVKRSEEDTVTCDRCGLMDEVDGMEGQEFLKHYQSCGFDSIFGDLNHIRLDLCQHCVKLLLGTVIQIFDEYGKRIKIEL